MYGSEIWAWWQKQNYRRDFWTYILLNDHIKNAKWFNLLKENANSFSKILKTNMVHMYSSKLWRVWNINCPEKLETVRPNEVLTKYEMTCFKLFFKYPFSIFFFLDKTKLFSNFIVFWQDKYSYIHKWA